MKLIKRFKVERRRKQWLASKLSELEDKTLIKRMGV